MKTLLPGLLLITTAGPQLVLLGMWNVTSSGQTACGQYTNPGVNSSIRLWYGKIATPPLYMWLPKSVSYSNQSWYIVTACVSFSAINSNCNEIHLCNINVVENVLSASLSIYLCYGFDFMVRRYVVPCENKTFLVQTGVSTIWTYKYVKTGIMVLIFRKV